MNFTNPAIAGKFKIVGDIDRRIEIPGGYKGMLSEVSDPAVIEGMIKRKSNLVALKDGKEPAAAGGPGRPTPTTQS